MPIIRTTFWGALLGGLMSLCGCGTSPEVTDGETPAATVVSEIEVSGFDADGEPVIRKLSDGSLQIQFEAMPPFFAEDAGIEEQFDDFQAKLETAAGVAVAQEDRELFVVAAPEEDTAQRIKTWLESYPKPE
ncbi:hypothetical protein AB1K70_20620 [Bremerella sp. JC770]|uniref:hypothetical protein n=1 Tax=Bremerella sp. JC770 TaxID=3232137 RepID=UPI00345A0003